jgi:multidrug transporter EmrE-like cation transporter
VGTILFFPFSVIFLAKSMKKLKMPIKTFEKG